MVEQVIKQRSKSGFEESPELVSVRGNGFVCKQGGQDALLELTHVPVDALVHLRIEAELIAKVLTDQAFVVARFCRDGIDTRPIKTVLGKDRFCCVEYCLLRTLCIMFSPASRFRHGCFIFPSISNQIVIYLS